MTASADAVPVSPRRAAVEHALRALDAGLARVLAASARLRVVVRTDARTVVARDEGAELAAASPASAGERAATAAVWPLEITVRLASAGADGFHVDVELGGWVTRVSRSPLRVTADASAAALTDDDELLDVLGLALDLVGAACFGEVRAVQIRRGRAVAEARVELAEAGDWSTIGEVRRLVWPFAPRTERTLQNREPRPDDCAAIAGPPLPWAPWAGRAGFVGRSLPTTAIVDLGRGGVLDLHGMEPRRVDAVVTEFIETSQRNGVLALRIIHGKGKGVFRDVVHRRLREHPAVRGFRIGGHGAGGWGATLVDLHPHAAARPAAPSGSAAPDGGDGAQ